jgi:hypothetical protein
MSNNFPFESFTNTDEALIHVDKSETHRVFMLCRASAIEQYAHFENILFRLFVYLKVDTEERLGDFYHNKLNAQSRLVHIKKALENKHGNCYELFWSSFYEHIKELSIRRNLIIHWTVAKTLEMHNLTNKNPSSNPSVITVASNSYSSLRVLGQWDKDNLGRELFLKDLLQFTMACNLFYHITQHFIWIASDSPKILDVAWKDVFKSKVVLPIPESHPLFNYLKPAVDAKMGLLG